VFQEIIMRKSVLAASLSLVSGLAVAESSQPSMEEMWKIIQQQAAEIKALKEDAAARDKKIEITDLKVEATADSVEKVATTASAASSWAEKTSIGAYGELHYNKLEDQKTGKDTDKIDLHRFVLFVGHEFSDSVRFFSEFEVEHSIAGEGQPGEIEIEQAFVEWDWAQNQQAKAGVFLIPIGILNETHEPDTFFGTERNKVESEIIPSTWWEGGAGLSGELAPGLRYDAAVHSGLFLDDTARIRSGRQKVGNAKADDYAYTARLKYTGIQGLELSATLQYQSDLFQGEEFGGADSVDALLYELHAIYKSGPFGLRALYAAWDIDDGINAVTDRTDADEREGFYIEPSYMITPKLGVALRYSEWDDVRATAGFDMKMEELMFGINYYVSPTVVLKADYQDQDAAEGRAELDGFNLGVGWSF
jgi:hypothetical protein